jgi:hypothetical protein
VRRLLSGEGVGDALAALSLPGDVTVSVHRGPGAEAWLVAEEPEGVDARPSGDAGWGVAVGDVRVIGGLLPDGAIAVEVRAAADVRLEQAPEAWLAALPEGAAAWSVVTGADGGVLEEREWPVRPAGNPARPHRRLFRRLPRGQADY